MKRQAVVVLLTAACTIVSIGLPVNAVTAAAPCTNIPLRFTLSDNRAIRSDGGSVDYTSDRSTMAEIKVCAGTNDAVLNTSKRKFVLEFPSAITSPGGVPSWVPGLLSVVGVINVRNVLYNKGQDTPFTTRVGLEFTASVDGATYRLGFMQYQVDAPDLHNDPDRVTADNMPSPSSAALVTPAYPDTCTSSNRPTWLVQGWNANGEPEVGTLHKIPASPRGLPEHRGQYNMPFEMRIDALACFTYP